MSETPMNPVVPPQQKGYGKRPLWQWILIYVVIAIVVYGAIYYFAFAKKGSSETNGNTNQTSSFPY